MAAVMQTLNLGKRTMLSTGTKVAVVGLGKTGLSALRFLHRQGIECLAIDSRPNPPALEAAKSLGGIPVFTGGLRADILSWATHLLVSPGIGLDQPEIRSALERGVALLSDIDLFAEAAAAPVVAVTGSNGKSTVTTLVAEMARQAGIRVKAGGNLGVPVLDLLEQGTELYVVELSSFQLDRTRRLQPHVGVVLNICPDHMDRYPNLDSYAASKGKLFQLSKICVANADDRQVMALLQNSGCHQRLLFSLASGGGHFHLQQSADGSWLCHGDEPLLATREIQIQGRHNLANALAALALAEAAGIPMSARLKALRQFQGLAHRMQTVAEIDGVTWINDSKGTNVGATVAAISGLQAPVILLAGGDGKGADFAPLAEHPLKAAVLFGKDRERLRSSLEGATQTHVVDNLTEAVELARRLAQAGDVVLLSPACASLDQFEDYQARGRCFIEAVKSLS